MPGPPRPAEARVSPPADEEPPPWPDDPNWGGGSEGPPPVRMEDGFDGSRRPTPAEVRGSSSDGPRRLTPAATTPAPSKASQPLPAAATPRPTATPQPMDTSAADCGTGCPGSPQPERAGVIAWANMPPMAAWEAFLDRLRGNEGPMFGMLAELGLATLGDGVLRLAGTATDFARNHLREQAPLRSHLESLLQQHLGLPFKLELVEGEPSLPDLPSLGLVEQKRADELQKQVELEVASSPQIQALKAQFNAQVRTVKPRGAPQSRGL